MNRLKSLTSKLLKNSFLKVTGANGMVSLASSLLTMTSTKVLAMIIGTSGIAMIGQLQSFIQIITLISEGGFNQGVTKYIAEDKEDKNKIAAFVGTAFIFSFSVTFILALLILVFSKVLTLKIFTTDKYVSILVIFALTLFLFNVNSLILAVVNGFQNYRKYFKIRITTTVVGFVLTILLVLSLNEYGALLAIILAPSVICLLSLFYVRNEFWVKALYFRFFDKEKLKLLLKYTSITVFAAIIWPVERLILRTYVINHISADEAGLWQATQNINNYIVNIAIGSFSIYLLPKLSSITNNLELKKELISIFKWIVPISLVGFFAIYILRDFVVLLLYSKDFLKVGYYLPLQMLGSFFWMCKVPLMNYLLAKEHTNVYIVNELVFALMYILVAIVLIPMYQVQGIQMAFAVYNFFYLITNVILVRKYLKE